ncbi:MAG TPA: sugar ABC transporter permease [Chloroflexi bacterium]|nr:sugar ABC transporter permease [Chloroflexota bacterium]
MQQGRVVPWLYLLPALIVIAVFILYPTANTFQLSLRDRTGSQPATAECVEGEPCWGPFENYRYTLTSPEMLTALRNNALWILVMVPITIGIGLVIAVLADRVRYESLVKSIIFMPMAISFIGAGVIWRFMYHIETGSLEQIGVLNAILVGLGLDPVPWLSTAWVNNFALMAVGVWLWAGFCMTILSAALKGLPPEVIEAARVDGATEWQLFWQVMMPMILPTVTVVLTTMIIIILKIFDIVFVMTGGLFGTEVIANRMFKLIVTHTGRSTAIAMLLLVLTIPVMVFNVRRFREQEAMR